MPRLPRTIPWNRTFFTLAWGSWRCSGCDSLLAIDVRRRLLAIALAVAVLFAVTRVVGPLANPLAVTHSKPMMAKP